MLIHSVELAEVRGIIDAYVAERAIGGATRSEARHECARELGYQLITLPVAGWFLTWPSRMQWGESKGEVDYQEGIEQTKTSRSLSMISTNAEEAETAVLCRLIEPAIPLDREPASQQEATILNIARAITLDYVNSAYRYCGPKAAHQQWERQMRSVA